MKQEHACVSDDGQCTIIWPFNTNSIPVEICIIVKVTDIDLCLAQIFQPSKEANYVHITCIKAVLTTYALSKLYASIV